MIIPAARIEIACSDDPFRPVLNQVWFAREGDDAWLYATDAYILVQVRVEAEHDDVEGPISLAAIKHARKKSRSAPTIHLLDDAVVVSDAIFAGGEARYTRLKDGQPPNFQALIECNRPSEAEQDDEPGEIGINPTFLARAATALGATRQSGVRFSFVGGVLQPVVVTLSDRSQGRAIVMPIRMNS